jgi:hypothetical protein
MDYFYIIVSAVAVIALIVLLTIVGIGLRKRSKSKDNAWPPYETTCPDYWKVDKSDTKYCVIPDAISNYRNAGTIYKDDGGLNVVDRSFNEVRGYDSNGLRINFADPYYTACNKQNWAKRWNVYWDGYTNYNSCGLDTKK